MRVIPASAGEGRSCMYTVQCTTEGMNLTAPHTDKKRKSNFPDTVYKEIHNGAVAKSYTV
jgi:hypothetical protein